MWMGTLSRIKANRNQCCQQTFSFVLVWHCHPWRHCLPSVAQRDDQQSLGIRKGFGSNPVNDWILADICALSFPIGCGMPNVPGDSWRGRPWLSSLLQITLWGLERSSLKSASTLSCISSVKRWGIYSCDDLWASQTTIVVWQIRGIELIKLKEITTLVHKSGPACMKYLCCWCQIS